MQNYSSCRDVFDWGHLDVPVLQISETGGQDLHSPFVHNSDLLATLIEHKLLEASSRECRTRGALPSLDRFLGVAGMGKPQQRLVGRVQVHGRCLDLFSLHRPHRRLGYSVGGRNQIGGRLPCRSSRLHSSWQSQSERLRNLGRATISPSTVQEVAAVQRQKLPAVPCDPLDGSSQPLNIRLRHGKMHANSDKSGFQSFLPGGDHCVLVSGSHGVVNLQEMVPIRAGARAAPPGLHPEEIIQQRNHKIVV
mmetsp:Transcript_59143/g.127397  ORF Transcript_59143/g.127397 Transcript_59143/m.127397 type:complete len:250 (-) Transcript_59143:1481-2230(-)